MTFEDGRKGAVRAIVRIHEARTHPAVAPPALEAAA